MAGSSLRRRSKEAELYPAEGGEGYHSPEVHSQQEATAESAHGRNAYSHLVSNVGGLVLCAGHVSGTVCLSNKLWLGYQNNRIDSKVRKRRNTKERRG